MFNISKFTSVAGQTLSSNAEMHWLYETQDSADTIQKSAANVLNNYFGEVHSLLSEGNIITVRHMSTPDATAATKSMTSTLIDEIDYVVLYKGEHRDANGRVIKDVFVYPLEAGQRIMVRKFDDTTAFTNKDLSFQFPVCVSKIGVVRVQTLTNNLTLTLKQHDNDGAQIGTVQMSAANSAIAGYFNETAFAKSTKCVETTFNIAGNTPANSSVPFIVYLVAEGDEEARLDQIALNANIDDANANANVDFVSPTSGLIKRLLVGTSVNAVGNPTYTLTINGAAVENGVATVANGTKTGVATPTGQNILAAGDAIRVAYTVLGAAGSSAVSILIER